MIRKFTHIMLFAALILNLTGSAAISRADGCCLMPCCSPAGCEAPPTVEDPSCCDLERAECSPGTGDMGGIPEAAVSCSGPPPFPREAAAVLTTSGVPAVLCCLAALAPAPGRLPARPGKIPLYLSNAVHLC